jgi:hypothetical protein
MLTMKVARSALPVTLAHWERVGVRETVMAAATDFVPCWFSGGGADAMAVSAAARRLTLARLPLLPLHSDLRRVVAVGLCKGCFLELAQGVVEIESK